MHVDIGIMLMNNDRIRRCFFFAIGLIVVDNVCLLILAVHVFVATSFVAILTGELSVAARQAEAGDKRYERDRQ